LPSNGLILGQREIPPVAQQATLTIHDAFTPSRVVWLDADDASLAPLPLELATRTGSDRVYHLPPSACWSIVVVEGKEKTP
jgi:hypothetical protein